MTGYYRESAVLQLPIVILKVGKALAVERTWLVRQWLLLLLSPAILLMYVLLSIKYGFYFYREQMMKTLATLFLLLVVSAQLAACNTMQGFGKDVQRGGEAIEKTAK